MTNSPRAKIRACLRAEGPEAAARLGAELGVRASRVARWIRRWSGSKSGSLVGTTVVVGPRSSLGGRYAGTEAEIVEVTREPAWPVRIRLCDGQITMVEPWEIEIPLG